MSARLDFFAAANSAEGFYSLFDTLYEKQDKPEVFLIQGGPGTGKSTICRKVADEALRRGETVEYIHCSSDPDSLDGAVCRGSNLFILDATPPHQVRPKLAGVIENTLDVGAAWDREKLRVDADRICRLDSEITDGFRTVSAQISAAGDYVAAKRRFGMKNLDCERLKHYSDGFCTKLFGSKKPLHTGKRHIRFLSGITPKGLHIFDSTVTANSDRIFLIEDNYATAGPMIADAVGGAALAAGHDCWFCRCPMNPECTEHVLIPDIGIAVMTVNAFHAFEAQNAKKIPAGRFYLSHDGEAERVALRVYDKAIGNRINKACEQLEGIKKLHDRLEELYKSAMDFSRNDLLAESVIARLATS